MTYRNEETDTLTLRSISLPTRDVLYEYKTLKGKPICQLVDEIVTDYVENHPSRLQLRQRAVRRLVQEYAAGTHETCKLTLRSVRRSTIEALCKYKTLTGKPIYQLVDEIVTDYVENHPSMLQLRQEQVRRLVQEFSAQDVPDLA